MKVASALLVISLLMAGQAWAQSKIGYVDLQRALNESDAGKKAKEEFKQELDKLQAKLKTQREKIDELKDQIDKKAMVLKDEERQNLEDDYQKKMRDFERAYKDSQSDLQAKDNELTSRILKQLQVVIQKLGARENYLLILEDSSNVMLYGAKSADLTDEVIKEYNRSHAKR